MGYAATARAKSATRIKRNNDNDNNKYPPFFLSGTRSTGIDLATIAERIPRRLLIWTRQSRFRASQMYRDCASQTKENHPMKWQHGSYPGSHFSNFLKGNFEPQDSDNYSDDKEYPVINFINKSLWNFGCNSIVVKTITKSIVKRMDESWNERGHEWCNKVDSTTHQTEAKTESIYL
jgi:hypothetical protein